ncbi:hypothetical protein HDU93_004279, partial [Gonapodya sp. JEL0774]
ILLLLILTRTMSNIRSTERHRSPYHGALTALPFPSLGSSLLGIVAESEPNKDCGGLGLLDRMMSRWRRWRVGRLLSTRMVSSSAAPLPGLPIFVAHLRKSKDESKGQSISIDAQRGYGLRQTFFQDLKSGGRPPGLGKKDCDGLERALNLAKLHLTRMTRDELDALSEAADLRAADLDLAKKEVGVFFRPEWSGYDWRKEPQGGTANGE